MPDVVDMSVMVGGRKVEPALAVVDGSCPTPQETEFDSLLSKFSARHIPLESSEGIKTRERVLNRLGAISRSWIESVCRRLLLPQEVVVEAGGQLFTSGSYRLGVHEPGADIDCILVVPEMCTREDFFGSNAVFTNAAGEEVRDPDSLAMRIRNHPDVTNFNAVEGAAVPILTFDWEGINIDLLFARLKSPSVPADLDIDNDGVLDGVDSATEKSLNGPRVTNLIAAAVSGTPERYQTFLKVVRCVRRWAKARGLYSNKMGYWGGVNINIAVAFCLQLYPNANPASLLRKFFLVFKTWRWPNPIMLTKPHDANLGLTVWSPQQALGMGGTHRQVAPMITPAYPAMNSALSVSRQTLQIFQEEFNRGHAILDRIWKDFKSYGIHDMTGGLDGGCFEELFRPSDFFISYPHYLSLCIVGPTQEDVQAWAGFVESRMRKLVSDLLGKSLPLSKIQLWPKKFEACIADKTAGEALTEAQRRNCLTYFIGFHIDTLRMRGLQLNVEQQIQKFKEYDLNRYQPLLPGQDVLFRSFKVKELPLLVFEGVYPEGKREAMKKRKRMIEADPKHQEAKRLAKLSELRNKMAKMQEKLAKKKKDEDGAPANVKTEDQAEPDTVTSTLVKLEPTDDDDAALLENTLDNLQEGGKSREEAELERQKLLAGDLLVEGADANERRDEDDDDSYEEGFRNTRPKKSIAEIEAEILQKAGFTVVSDEETTRLGEAFRRKRERKPMPNIEIKLRTKFDVVELDANGFVVDKGDDDFKPSKSWTGRKAGFEFKLGERGLGYYRTGKKVVVPSNIAY